MMKNWLILFIIIACFGLFPTEVKASLVKIDPQGQMTLQVLSSSDSLALEIPTNGELGIKQAAAENETTEAVSLTKEADKISLKIGSAKLFDVTNWKEKVVEIEERPEVKSIEIDLWQNQFRIATQGVFALTSLPITIDPGKDKFSVETEAGEQYVAVLPNEAVQTALRAKVLSRTDATLELVAEANQLAYLVKGEKVINLFNFYQWAVPVTAKVSAATGEIYFVDQPPWLRVLGVLFS